jgi:hypothetical protein
MFIMGLYAVHIAKHIHFYFVIIGGLELIITIILTIYILRLQLKFIFSYDLSHCNPSILVQKILASKLVTATSFSILFASILGAMNSLDDTFAKAHGESAITKLGKYYG